MTSKRRLLLAVLVLLVALGGGWYWYSRPQLPDIPLAGVDPAIAAAIEEAQTEVRRQPRSADAWGKLGMVLLGNQFHERAAHPFAQAAALAPEDEQWPYLHGLALTPFDPPAALPHLRRAAELGTGRGERQAALHLRLAEVLLANGLHDEAEKHLRQVLVLVPDHPCAHYGLGVVAQTQGDLPRSKEHLIRCADSPLTRQRAGVQLAALCQRLGDEAAAAKYSAAALEAGPELPWSDPYLAEAQRLAVGRKILLDAFAALGAKGDWPAAAQVARRLVRDYADAASYLNLGIALGRTGEYEESESCLRKCLELQPGIGQAQYYLSLALFAQGEGLGRLPGKQAESAAKFRASIEWARRAIALNDRHAEAHFQLGLALTCVDDSKGAIEAFRRAVEVRPEMAEPHLWLGKALAEAGQTAEATVHLENAARHAAAGDTRARQALEDIRNKRK
jgi:tetratricopeptide (TPR) repeat protein